jgi:hypothetical protein
MPQIFRQRANSIARCVLASILLSPLLLVGLGYAVTRSPYVTGQDVARDQPVPFSHQHHVGGVGLDCRYCHDGVEKGRYAGVPPTQTCMTCHSQLWTNAEMLAPVRKSLADDVPIRWQRVHNLPDYVYFDHSIHVAKGVGCTTCHGPVDRMPLMRQQAPLTMGWCLDCHRAPEKYVRPLADVFSTTWTPPADQIEQGRKLLAAYVAHPKNQTDCSVCHR